MNAQLPNDLRERTLQDMKPGEAAWTVPWAMFVESDSRLWLNGNYTALTEAMGTAQMHIKREEGGYVVSLRRCPNERWSMGACFVGDFEPLPVIRIDR